MRSTAAWSDHESAKLYVRRTCRCTPPPPPEYGGALSAAPRLIGTIDGALRHARNGPPALGGGGGSSSESSESSSESSEGPSSRSEVPRSSHKRRCSDGSSSRKTSLPHADDGGAADGSDAGGAPPPDEEEVGTLPRAPTAADDGRPPRANVTAFADLGRAPALRRAAAAAAERPCVRAAADAVALAIPAPPPRKGGGGFLPAVEAAAERSLRKKLLMPRRGRSAAPFAWSVADAVGRVYPVAEVAGVEMATAAVEALAADVCATLAEGGRAAPRAAAYAGGGVGAVPIGAGEAAPASNGRAESLHGCPAAVTLACCTMPAGAPPATADIGGGAASGCGGAACTAAPPGCAAEGDTVARVDGVANGEMEAADAEDAAAGIPLPSRLLAKPLRCRAAAWRAG